MQKQLLNFKARKNTYYLITYTTQEYLEEFGEFIANLQLNTATIFNNITHIFWAEEYNAQNKLVGQSTVLVKYADGTYGKEHLMF